MTRIPAAVIERLTRYRRHLRILAASGQRRVFSHELGQLIGATSSQVRRDLMTIGFSGSPARGYDVDNLIEDIGAILDPGPDESFTQVGVGHLGRAILEYFHRRRPDMVFHSAFDSDPNVIGQVFGNCRVQDVARLEQVLADATPMVAILAVPRKHAQEVADRLVQAGVRGILNFAPLRLRTPDSVYVEHVDIAASAEKVLFFARQFGRSSEPS